MPDLSFQVEKAESVPFAVAPLLTLSVRVTDGDLQVAPISWEKEAVFRLPVHVWRAMMDHYYPNSAWLCLRRDLFERLYRYKVEHGLPTWEQTLESLLPALPKEVRR